MIVLRDYLDLSYAQIADVLGIAQGTVMSRLHRSRLALKEALDKDGQ
jgi:RNA polymerase sigma-70 factor (ECF subfamily)